MFTLSYRLIHHNPEIVRKATLDAFADRLLPQLKQLIETTAREIADEFDPDSPFARDAAVDILVSDLAHLLAIGGHEQVLHISQMTGAHARCWLDGVL